MKGMALFMYKDLDKILENEELIKREREKDIHRNRRKIKERKKNKEKHGYLKMRRKTKYRKHWNDWEDYYD